MPTLAHAFVAMPFGRKPGPEGVEVDYDRVYRELIAPAIEQAGLSAFRADQELSAGSILTDMFQELLVADLVVADLSIANPNVWYELGVRHALRSRGVVLLFGSKAPAAFDLYSDRKLRYSLAGDGPDPSTLAQDRDALAAMIRATMTAWHERKTSPVYQHLPNLQEPDWKSLRRAGNVKALWDEHDRWLRRLEQARQTGRIGDLLMLADEGPVAAFRAEAWVRAGIALRKANQFAFALDYLNKGLAVEPAHLQARREVGICLQRLALQAAPGHSASAARQHYQAVLEDHPKDIETWALLGRLDKDAWVATWRRDGSDAATMRADAAYEDALLRAAIQSYERAFRTHPGHYYSGINALTLMHLGVHLGVNLGANPGAAGGSEPHARQVMAGALRFAAENESEPSQAFWARSTLGDLEVLVGTPDTVQAAYKEALAVPDIDWFSISSSRDQLLLLRDLGFRPEAVAAGLSVFDRRLSQLRKPDAAWQPRQVLLFSGHMVDAPGRKTPRFPAEAVPLADKAIGDTLDGLAAGPDDLALCQAAAGGDLLFLEACRRRGVKCQVLLPFDQAEYLNRSVLPSADGVRWRDRFYAALDPAHCTVREMPTELGPLPGAVDPFVRANLWLLYTALALGAGKVRFITLWNGSGGDGPGGTAHMVQEVKRQTGRVYWIDTRQQFKPVLPMPG